MLRRTVLLGLAGSVVSPVARAALKPVIRISGLWAEGPFGNTQPGQQRGRLRFAVNGGNARTLISYINDHPTNGAAGKRECVELIKRYASILGFSRFPASKVTRADDGNGLPTLGNGVDAARNFADESGGTFVYRSDGQADLPKTGSVLSTQNWTELDGRTKVPGHVGIVCNYDPPRSNTTSVAIKLFDQNMDKSSVFKDVVFTRRSGKWYGQMRINSLNILVKGWATPS